MSRVAIIGSRNAPEGLLLRVSPYIETLTPGTVIVTGAWWSTRDSLNAWRQPEMRATAGIDGTAAYAADKRGLVVMLVAGPHSAGKLTGLQRNPAIIDAADRVVAFWDGRSPGTKHGIDYCRAHGKELLIIRE